MQGVGFRPALHRLAADLGLTGTISNSGRGVEAELEGPRAALDALLARLDSALPEHAVVESRQVRWLAPRGERRLSIVASTQGSARGARLPPDLATCAACRAEIFDAADRRHGYAFTNCTACGPRFTITRRLPYDRARTTMAPFALCPACEEEYGDLTDRRHHAEPVACPECGPRLVLTDDQGRDIAAGEALAGARRRLRAGEIVAIKGLGGWHLAVDATSDRAVARLRRRKVRPHRPLAVMARDLEQARTLGDLGDEASRLLASPAAPIVLLPALDGSPLSPRVAPGLDRVGLLLAYTPLHHLLLRGMPPLVMTSGNRGGEPIAVGGDEARRRLAGIADCWLDHDREILAACEDSVISAGPPATVMIRRSRGFVPDPLPLPREAGSALALGGQQKVAPCLVLGKEAIPGPHVGDLDSPEGLAALERAVGHLTRLLGAAPAAVLHDLHPDYVTTRHAQKLGLPALAVQHHHAHAAAVAGEHGLEGPLLALVLDGTGYGDDGTVWGGELLLLPDPGQYQRVGSLRPFPLPGGERAVHQPWRSALGLCLELLGDAGGERAGRALGLDEQRVDAVRGMLRNRVATVTTSSAGRLFDAVAALCGIAPEPTYEGQPAVELEAAAARAGAAPGAYEMPVRPAEGRLLLDPSPALEAVLADLAAGAPVEPVAARFHGGLAAGLVEMTAAAAAEAGVHTVALAGGCLVNRILCGALLEGLRAADLEPLLPRRLPCNDGGLSYGQAVVCAFQAGTR